MAGKKFRASKIYRLFAKLNSKDFGNLLDQIKVRKYEQEELRKKGGLRVPFEKEYIDSFNGIRERRKRN